MVWLEKKNGGCINLVLIGFIFFFYFLLRRNIVSGYIVMGMVVNLERIVN